MSEFSYTIEAITEQDEEGILSFLKRSFFFEEPLNKAIGLCSETTDCKYLDTYCVKSIKQLLSFKAVDKEGNIVGCILNSIIKKADEENDMLTVAQKCDNKKFQKILYIFAHRIKAAKLWEKYPNIVRLLDVNIASTDPAWMRKGIMNALVKQTEMKAKELGISLMRLDTSSAYSAKSAESCGFTCVYKVAYVDLKLDGQPIIVPEEPHKYDCVYIKNIEHKQ